MLDLTAYDAALKSHYTDDRVENMVYADNPFLALIPKMEKFGGRDLPIPIIYGNPQGRSRTFANAQARAASTNSLVEDFVLLRKKDYSLAHIDNETLEASKEDADAFMDAATTEIDGAIQAATNNLAQSIYRTADGARGQVLAEPTEASSTVITMKNRGDIASIEKGMMIVIYSAASGGSIRTTDGSDDEWEVTAVDRSAGTFTLAVTYSSSGTIAANDYIFVEGDRGAALAGLESWVPATAPAATAFFGVDRSVDTRLGGLRLDGTGLPIEEALIEADAMVAGEGWGVDHFFMHTDTVADLKKALGTKVQYVDLQANAKISFRAIIVDGTKGPIKVVGDHNCQSNRIWGLKLAMWKLYTLGKAVRVLDTDGLQMLRLAASDGVEVRYGQYGNVGCRAPGANINVQI